LQGVGSRIVAVGASAGGVTALGDLLSLLPLDLDATVLVGLHLSSTGPSLLRQVLSRRSTLPVYAAEPGAPLRPGTVVVGPPDRHLLVVEGHLFLGTGAKENSHRPSHDAMMRSVALAAGPDAIGVILTGLLDDGSAGLRCIARYGGACLVQDPEDADFGDMPRNALYAVPDARVAPLRPLAQDLVDAVRAGARPIVEVDPQQRARDEAELASGLGTTGALSDGTHAGDPSGFACPHCHGVLNHVPDGDELRYRCRTGHAWSATSLLAEQREAVENALWVALRSLEERAEMFRRLAAQAEGQHPPAVAQHHRARSLEAEASASSLRVLLATTVRPPDSMQADG
jgi:two-component system chemotaxis response regulator CheB